jgi:hypothetical protein
MSLITKYKIFENQNTMILTEDIIKSILEKELFTSEVIEYFEYNYYPFYPSISKYDYSYAEKEDIYALHYEFENTKLGVINTINFNIRDFSSKMPYFKIYLHLNVEFKHDKNLFKTPSVIYHSNNIYNTYGGDDIFKSTRNKDKQYKTLIIQIKQVLKKVIKENVFKYGPEHLSIKEIVICNEFIKKIEELSKTMYIQDVTGLNNYPNKKNYKLIKYEDCVLKTTNPWSYAYENYIRLYFTKFDRCFIIHEQYIYKLKKIYDRIKKEVDNEFNN